MRAEMDNLKLQSNKVEESRTEVLEAMDGMRALKDSVQAAIKSSWHTSC